MNREAADAPLNARAIGQFLSSQSDSQYVEIVGGVEKNAYILRPMQSSMKGIAVNNLEDFSSFPASLH